MLSLVVVAPAYAITAIRTDDGASTAAMTGKADPSANVIAETLAAWPGRAAPPPKILNSSGEAGVAGCPH
jgi:hypothetical protein